MAGTSGPVPAALDYLGVFATLKGQFKVGGAHDPVADILADELSERAAVNLHHLLKPVDDRFSGIEHVRTAHRRQLQGIYDLVVEL
jgi:hypothetical protein